MRAAILQIDAGTLARLADGNIYRVHNPVPRGAHVGPAGTGPGGETLALVTSPELPDVGEGRPLPRLRLTFERQPEGPR